MVLAESIAAVRSKNTADLIQANKEQVKEIAGLKNKLDDNPLYQRFDKIQAAGLEIVSHQLDDAEMESVGIDDIYLLDITGAGTYEHMKPNRSLLVSYHLKEKRSSSRYILCLPGENSRTDKFAALKHGVCPDAINYFVEVPIFEDDGNVKDIKLVSIIEIAPTVDDFPGFSGQLPFNDGGELKAVVQKVIDMSLMNKINQFEAMIQDAIENQQGDQSETFKVEWKKIMADLDKVSTKFDSVPGEDVENKILGAEELAKKLLDPERNLQTTENG